MSVSVFGLSQSLSDFAFQQRMSICSNIRSCVVLRICAINLFTFADYVNYIFLDTNPQQTLILSSKQFSEILDSCYLKFGALDLLFTKTKLNKSCFVFWFLHRNLSLFQL